MSPEVAEDFESGLEYAQAAAVLDMRQRGTMRKYLVRWAVQVQQTVLLACAVIMCCFRWARPRIVAWFCCSGLCHPSLPG